MAVDEGQSEGQSEGESEGRGEALLVYLPEWSILGVMDERW